MPDDFDDFDDFAAALDDGADARADFLESMGEIPEVDTADDPDLRWSQWEAALQDYVDSGQLDPQALDELEAWYADPDWADWDDYVADVEGDDADLYGEG